MNIKKVTKKSAVHQVMAQIKTLIADGELKPGDRIPTETMLMEQFGTGRSTIREALKIFEFLGIIEAHTRTGTFVCNFSSISSEALTWSILMGKNELFELVDLRSIIEQRALELVITRAADDPEFLGGLIEKLENAVGEMENAVNNAGMEKIIAADYTFHGVIINAGGKTIYSHVYQTLKSFMHEEIKKTNRENGALSNIVDEHRDIIVAISRTDLDAALNAFCLHIGNTILQLS